MTEGRASLVPRRLRTLCDECRAELWGAVESYAYESWDQNACRRSRRWHRRAAIANQPGVTTYKNGQLVNEVPLDE